MAASGREGVGTARERSDVLFEGEIFGANENDRKCVAREGSAEGGRVKD